MVTPVLGLETGFVTGLSGVLGFVAGAGVVTPMVGLETGGLAGLFGLLGFAAGVLGLETPVVGVVTGLAGVLSGLLLEDGLVTLEAVVITVWVLRGVVVACRGSKLEFGKHFNSRKIGFWLLRF